ncbi:MAG: DNA polymerase III subunit alpha, partial [Acidimicrobiales bacterium]
DKATRLAFEKEMLGLYVSDHPMMGVGAALRRLTDTGLAELRDAAAAGTLAEGSVRVVGGVVTALSRRWTKRGELMATFVLEDLEAAMEVFVFPRVMSEVGALLEDDAIVCVKARLDTREDQAKLVCLEVSRPALPADGSRPLAISVPVPALTESKVVDLKALLGEHPGDSPVHLLVGESVLRLPSQFNVDAGRGLLGSLRELLGAGAVVA